jgi:phenylpropionate dioxygenase-like ring-hydroxylating dioxygenase large terminal subunit
MQFEDFWYVVALSRELCVGAVLSRTVLDEWLVIFRGADGKPVALRDRCLHRHSRLSTGKVYQGILQCSYHGWQYDQTGQVVAVPAEGDRLLACDSRQAKAYATCEQDGYVYVRLAEQPQDVFTPFAMPHYGEPGWASVRVINRFRNNVTNCVENFIDIPHTVFVHPGIFRKSQRKQLMMKVERSQGAVYVEYANETTNLGWWTRFLNPEGNSVKHCDRFYMPNVTCVNYHMRENRQLYITSQSIPETQVSTLVYTDVTYNYGFWTKLAYPFVRWTTQKIIDQDIQVLNTQGEVLEKYGTQFSHTPADTIHNFVESIQATIAAGNDPRLLADKSVNVTFWV